MSHELNLSIVEGHLTRDPELFFTKNGNSICKFDIAVNFKFKGGEKEYKEVSYISVNTWSKIAEACSKFLKKGSKVRVRGRLKQDNWTTKDGQRRQKLHIEASVVEFLRTNKKNQEIKSQESQKEVSPF